MEQLRTIDAQDLRCVSLQDFKDSIASLKPSVGSESVAAYELWNDTYGTNSV